MKKYILISGLLLIQVIFISDAGSFDSQGGIATGHKLIVGTPGKKAFCKKANFLNEELEVHSSFVDFDKDVASTVLIEDAKNLSKDPNLAFSSGEHGASE
ncbi:MAG: hypothetical protein J0H12_07545 [Candidatus Paracaedimonas acanthamoebae]|uniref:Uncharacterized protein n=1 Tax=Candidatus Paracaedimonas acanthamoebae TaxID=244581 RepID=A0A8J7TVI0_9PROT|nr:hypothetical protein [Candidatus Paracaedimonas acanthamoebae]